MTDGRDAPLWETLGLLFKAHPWHGVPIGPDAPAVVTAHIEIVPTDTVKYEVDKRTGYLKVDRPQQFSNVAPTVYGRWRDIADCPASVIDRLRHYFLTYKESPDSGGRPVEIAEVYGREAAHAVIAASQADYAGIFPGLV